MKRSFQTILLFLLLLLPGQVGGQSTDLSNANILVLANRIVQFTPSTSAVQSIETPLDQIYGDRRQSPRNNHVVAWETSPNYFENGIWLIGLNDPYASVQFPIDRYVNYHYVDAQWPLGERFALIQTGIVTGGDPEYPNPIWMLDTNAWLVDVLDQTIRPWYWNCNKLIFIDDLLTVADVDKEFAVQCTAYLPPFAVETMFLTAEGPRMDVDRPYHALYTRTMRYEPGWVFTPEMDQVAVVNRHNDGPLRDEVLTYGLDGSARWIATFDRQTQPVSSLFWSPTGHYLGISTGCLGLTISDCFQIRDMQTSDIIWDSSRLGETLYGSRYLSVTSVYWLEAEDEFLLLGQFANEDRGSYIWHVSLDQDAPLSRWDVPSSSYAIIGVTD